MGWALLSNGDQYEGEYKNGLRDGTGTYFFKNGHRYIGNWKTGLKHGKGKFHYPDGSSYEGEWCKDLKQGFGIYTYLNLDRYEGNWFQGKRHGTGHYIYHEDDTNFYGTWENGILQGPAELIHETYRLHTHWKDGGPIGKSAFTFARKYMTVGVFEEQKNVSEELLTKKGEEGKISKFPPKRIWQPTEVKLYDFASLPQQPIPLPVSDSLESMCPESVSSCEDESVSGGEEMQEEEQ